ncbi:hypothetical protein KKH3_04390 [Pectobacterium actinidiae]|nr:hypothetical protein KKH3_04390 [Pectobacterium actinidiae]
MNSDMAQQPVAASTFAVVQHAFMNKILSRIKSCAVCA